MVVGQIRLEASRRMRTANLHTSRKLIAEAMTASVMMPRSPRRPANAEPPAGLLPRIERQARQGAVSSSTDLPDSTLKVVDS